MRVLCAMAVAALCVAGSARADDAVGTDLRTLRVGMPASELPPNGYADFACAGGGKSLGGWAQWRECPPNGGGIRELSFRYGDKPEHDTVVAGQPVLLSLGIDDGGTVQSLTMRSDPSGRVFLRKRGVHFGERVMNHYGAAGWTCTDGDPAPGEEAVGTLFVRQHCEKTMGDRHLVVDRALYRHAGQSPDKFVSQSIFTVSLAKPNAR